MYSKSPTLKGRASSLTRDLCNIRVYLREVPYARFRRAGQALGESAPLHGLWTLVDQFAPY